MPTVCVPTISSVSPNEKSTLAVTASESLPAPAKSIVTSGKVSISSRSASSASVPTIVNRPAAEAAEAEAITLPLASINRYSADAL